MRRGRGRREGGVVVPLGQDPLAARPIVGCDRIPQLGILDLKLEGIEWWHRLRRGFEAKAGAIGAAPCVGCRGEAERRCSGLLVDVAAGVVCVADATPTATGGSRSRGTPTTRARRSTTSSARSAALTRWGWRRCEGGGGGRKEGGGRERGGGGGGGGGGGRSGGGVCRSLGPDFAGRLAGRGLRPPLRSRSWRRRRSVPPPPSPVLSSAVVASS